MKKNINLIQNLFMITYLVGVILKVLDIYEAWIPTLIGGVVLVCVRVFQRIKTTQKTGKPSRLPAILLFSSGLMVYSAYLMYSHKGYWVIPILIVAVLEFYVSLRMPKE